MSQCGVKDLAIKLINIESLSGYEHAMADFLEDYLTLAGWKVQRQAVAPEKGDGWARHNVLATRGECKGKGPRVLFNSHIDTVPPFFPAELGEENGDEVIRGRGACDTKGILAAQLTALQQLVEEEGASDIGLLYVVSEETDHSGMKASNDLGLDPEWLVVGEPTELKMMRLQKGMLKLRITATGVACHSGYPELGSSAIQKLLDCLQMLRTRPWPESEELGATTLNIGLISGGQAANALAEAAEASLLFRITCPPEEILAAVEAQAACCGCEVHVITQNAPVALSTLEGFETAVASYNTDIAYFKFAGKAILYGPGSISDAHARTEKIRVKDLEAAVEGYRKIARLCLHGKDK